MASVDSASLSVFSIEWKSAAKLISCQNPLASRGHEMVAAETYQIVVGIFPFFIIATVACTTVFMILLHRSEPKHMKKVMSLLRRRLKQFFFLIYLGLYVLLFASLYFAVFYQSEFFASLYNTSQFLLFLTITGLIGILVGFIIGGVHSRGVSLALVAAIIIFTVGLVPIYYNAVSSAYDFIFELLDTPFLLVFIIPSSGNYLSKRMLNITDPDDRTKNKAILDVAVIYVSSCLEILYKRMKDETDQIAQDACHSLLETPGSTGNFIRSIKNGEKEPSSSGQVADFLMSSNRMLFSAYQRRMAGRAMNLVPQGSWTLTQSKFERKVFINRVLYGSAISYLLIVSAISILDWITPFAYWMSVISIGLIPFSFPMAYFDNFFTAKRVSPQRITSEILTSLSDLEGIIETMEEEERVAAVESEDRNDVDSHIPKVPQTAHEEIMHDGFISSVPKELGGFLSRIKANKYSIHEEDTLPIYAAAAGFILSAPTLSVYFIMGLSHPTLSFFNLILVSIGGVGILLIMFGIVSWFVMTSKRMFRGLRRHWVSVGLSFLDAKESGVEDVGHIIMPPPPRQYMLFNMAGANSARMLLEHLKARFGAGDPKLERTSYEMQIQITKSTIPSMLVFVVILSIMGIFISGSIGLILIFLALLMLLLDMVAVLGVIRKKRKLAHSESQEEVVSLDVEGASVEKILEILHHEYEYPLRLMMSSQHEEVVYTGSRYSTSTGHTLYEAVFIPSRFQHLFSTTYTPRLASRDSAE